MTDKPFNLITVHGINTPNPMYYTNWLFDIPPEILALFNIIPVHWFSQNWADDLFNIGASKTFRAQQIKLVQDKLVNLDKPTLIVSHSWGTVWSYSALVAAHDLLKQSVWSVMVGAALGGTRIPFGPEYVDETMPKAIPHPHEYNLPPVQNQKWFNLFNLDDFVSGFISMQGMTNIEIDVGGFNPGFYEHDSNLYLKSMEFQWILQQFVKSFKAGEK